MRKPLEANCRTRHRLAVAARRRSGLTSSSNSTTARLTPTAIARDEMVAPETASMSWSVVDGVARRLADELRAEALVAHLVAARLAVDDDLLAHRPCLSGDSLTAKVIGRCSPFSSSMNA